MSCSIGEKGDRLEDGARETEFGVEDDCWGSKRHRDYKAHSHPTPVTWALPRRPPVCTNHSEGLPAGPGSSSHVDGSIQVVCRDYYRVFFLNWLNPELPLGLGF